MKARVKSNGRIIEVEKNMIGYAECTTANIDGFHAQNFYAEDELDFNISAPEKTQSKWWVARDKDGDLHLYTKKPMKGVEEYFGDYMHRLPEESLPSVTFENSPKRVRIEISIIE